MNKSKDPVSYSELIHFFLPLAITPFIIGALHNIANASIARLPHPELSLAVYSVVKGISSIIRAPLFMGKQAIISLVEDKESCQLVLKLIWLLGGLITFILFLMGYTPLGEFILKNIMGLKESQQITYGYYSLRIIFLLPLVEILRNNNQGLAISLKKTNLILPGILVRLVTVSLFFIWIIKTQTFPGITAGSLAWVGGIGLEGLFIFIVIRYYYKSPVKAADKIPSSKEKEQHHINPVTFLKFLSPLALMMLLTRVIEPIIQSGIARGSTPTQSLAAFGVAWTLVFLFTGPLRVLNQGTLVYVNKIHDHNWNHIIKFCFVFGVIIFFLILAVALTPPGFWLINSILAISEPVTVLARQTLIVFSLLPVIISLREAYWGILMNQNKTNIIGFAKIINILVVVTFLFSGIFLLDLNTAIIGAISFIIGEIFETWFIYYYSHHNENLIEKNIVKKY
ncbi:MAG: hypothetical protein ACOC4G_01410 [Bacillota bacterium]